MLPIKTYIDIAIGLLVVGLIVTAGWLYDQHKADGLRLDAAEKTQEQQAQQLRSLQAGHAASDEAINNMEDALLHQGVHATAVRQRVVNMGANDATVQTWLDAALPAGGCMLDDTCPASTAASAAQRGPAAALPASAAHAVPH